MAVRKSVANMTAGEFSSAVREELSGRIGEPESRFAIDHPQIAIILNVGYSNRMAFPWPVRRTADCIVNAMAMTQVRIQMDEQSRTEA